VQHITSKHNKYMGIIIICFIFCSLLFFQFPVDSHRSINDKNTVSYTIQFEHPSFQFITLHHKTFTSIMIDSCFSHGISGGPVHPIRPVTILLPAGTLVESVSFTADTKNITETCEEPIDVNHYPIIPMQQEKPIKPVNSTPTLEMNRTQYERDDFYPETYGKADPVQYCKGYRLLPVTLYPVQYNPKQGLIQYTQTITITLHLKDSKQKQSYSPVTLSDNDIVKKQVINPEILSTYESDQPHRLSSEYSTGLCNSTEHIDYVIITTQQNGLDEWTTTNSTPYNWTSLMTKHSTEDNLNCTLITIEEITACSAYWNDSSLFNDTAAQIRSFLKDAYQNWGIQYVLIGGDDELIPRREMDNYYETDVDSDLYWSNLDNTFNDDEDDYWGEEGDTGFDYYSELYIGSLPCDEPQDVSNWMRKSFYYTNSTDRSYLNNAGFYAGDTGWNAEGDDYIDFSAINGSKTFSGPHPNEKGPYPSWLGFQYGFDTWNNMNSSYQFNTSVKWTAESPNPGWNGGSSSTAINGLKQAINSNNVALLSAIAHANHQRSLDVNSSTLESEYHNTKPFFLHDYGCHCGDMDAADDGVLHSMLFHSDTELAFACIYNTGYGWGSLNSTNSSSSVQQKTFWDYFFDTSNNSGGVNNWQLGKAQAWSKDCLAPTINWSGSWRSMIQGCLLFGDPAQRLQVIEQNRAPVLSNEYPSNESVKISPAITSVHVMITDPNNDLFHWSIETIPDVGSASQTNDSNGNKTLTLSTNLKDNTTYHWWVNSSDDQQHTNKSFSFSTRKKFIPSVPTQFSSITRNLSQIQLTWGNAETNYTYIEYTTTEESWQRGNGTLLLNNSNSTTIIHDQLTEHTTYYYQLWTYNKTDHSYSSSFLSTNATTYYRPLPPTNFTSVSHNRTSIELMWNNTDELLTYIEYNTEPSWNKTEGMILLNTSETTSFLHTNLSCNTTYYYQCWSYNSSVKKYSIPVSSFNTTLHNNPPIIHTPTPEHEKTISTLQIDWSVVIDDEDDDLLTWSIQCSNLQHQSNQQDSAGLKTIHLQDLSYDTTYQVTVTVMDAFDTTEHQYMFHTPQPPTSAENINPTFPSTPSFPVNSAPVAIITTNTSIFVNKSFVCSAAQSYDIDNDTLSYRWDVQGDGVWDTSWIKSPIQHITYPEQGIYDVILQVSDGNDVNQTQQTVTVLPNTPPFIKEMICLPYAYTHTNFSVHITIDDHEHDHVRCIIDWDDATSTNWSSYHAVNSTIQFYHQWNTTGEKSIRIQLEDEHGFFTDCITVYAVMVYEIDISSPVLLSEEHIIQSNDSVVSFSVDDFMYHDGKILYVVWDFDDGQNATGEQVNHEFRKNGKYEITCTVTTVDGYVFSSSKTLLIHSNEHMSLSKTNENFFVFYGVVSIIFIFVMCILLLYYKVRTKETSHANYASKDPLSRILHHSNENSTKDMIDLQLKQFTKNSPSVYWMQQEHQKSSKSINDLDGKYLSSLRYSSDNPNNLIIKKDSLHTSQNQDMKQKKE